MKRSTKRPAKKIKIRRATARDIDFLVDQRRRMFQDIHNWTPAEHKIGDRSYRRWAVQMMKSKKFAGFLAFTEGENEPVAGGCVWLRENQPRPGVPAGNVPYLLSMYTKQKYRGLGLASKIVKEAMAWSSKRGCTTMTLHASKMGRRVYMKLGWERTWEMRIKLRSKGRR
ncbi:MAG: GNAT family N-acetyltransferase [Nitrososphaerales archaeon]